ncbi:MAG: site-specific integrase, partial [Imperialibacter sp.]
MRFTYKGWCNASKVRSDGKAPLYIRVRQGKNVAKVIKLDKTIEPNQFDNAAGYPVKAYRTASHLKRVIDNKVMEIEDVINDFERKGAPLSIETLVNLVSGHGDDFYKFAEFHLERESGLLSEKTIASYRTFLTSIKKYQPDLRIEQITTDWLNDFKYYLLSVKHRAPNGAAHEFTTISKFVQIALKKGIIASDPFLEFKKPKATPEINYLLPEELEALYQLWLGGELGDRLSRTAWYFLLSCYTSFRIKDVYELSLRMQEDPGVLANIIESGTIAVKTSKSRYQKTSSVPVNHIMDLLQRPPDRPMKQSNSRINTDVRDLMALIGVKRYLTYHSSRHTF